MTTTTLHPLATDYLDRLERAAHRLPRGDRRELLEEITAHLSEATHPGMSDAEMLTVLDRLGDPEDIVEAQRPDQPVARRGPGAVEWLTILLLLFGGFLVYVGWIAGAVMLWGSRAWGVREKLIGTLIVPGGLATALVSTLVLGTTQNCVSSFGGPERCTGGPSSVHAIITVAVFAFLVIGPLCSAVYLARRAR
ncbi:MAG: hypothetical protein JO027_20905 [Solirubrobacterales bacterium]|nr:hypothetical protein [Solirubrobacterales bacterium]